MKKVIILFGGQSLEHEVSIESAKGILKEIDKKKYQVVPIFISKEGTWYFYQESISNYKKMPMVVDIFKTLKSVDIVFPMIHGNYGEDGRIQSLLELYQIPYVGCNSKTSMICMDKEYTKLISAYHHIPILPFTILTKENIKEIITYPVIVKPANGGSSIGMGIAYHEKELIKRYKEASLCDTKVIVEPYKKVRELEVGMLSEKKKCFFSPIGEILKEENFYSYDSKYIHSFKTNKEANISDTLKKQIYEYASQIVSIFHLEGMARIDFFYEEDTNCLYFNEINTIPGFTPISMYPKLWASKKISYKKLITKLLENSSRK